MAKTPFYPRHEAAGARFVDFGGWDLPVQFEGLRQEHLATRARAGLFDVSHMGEIEILGDEALIAANRLITNDLEALKDGQACYTAMCRPDGGIIDDLVVYRCSPRRIFICCNAANRAKDFAWIEAQLKGAATAYDRSDVYAQLAIQGPLAAQIVQRLTPVDLNAIGFYHFAEGPVADVPCIISRTGYTGEDGFELYIPWARGLEVYDALREAGGADLIPVGLGARDTLRLEMKFALYGNDIDETTSPLEAGLGWVVKLNKPGGFIGQAALAAQKQAGLKRRLVAIKFSGKLIPRQGYPVVDASGAPIGVVTSGTRSPSLDESIAMAYVPEGQHQLGALARVQVRKQVAEGVIVKPPFVKPTPRA
ncbi:glycine cleavage system aminomethyltransferase GcvT [Myxococcota bacterium]|nr:glycine cleavage system aminomethyltransferase GcvT [Myxococcota bacterium]